MNEETRTKLALFRFSLIAPLVNGSTDRTAREYLEEICAKPYDVPGFGQREFSTSTLKHWLYAYRKHGLDGLKKAHRTDQGKFRTLSSEAQEFIMEDLKANPGRTALAIYQDLVNARLADIPSLSTVQRFVRNLRSTLIEPEIERRRYECKFANDCWQSDVCVGPYLLVGGKKKRTYLIAILDDASRLIVHSQFFFQGNYLALEETFRQALLKRGIPKKLFVDNGKVFQSQQLQLICARLGIAVSFARPYSPASKGKIERYFRTFRDQFLSQLDLREVSSLEVLNKLNLAFTEETYNRRPHSSLQGKSPIDRFLEDQDKLQFPSHAQLERQFLHEVKRRVTKDAIVSLDKVAYEVPQIYCGCQVKILFSPYDSSQVYLVPPGEETSIRIDPVRTVDNSQIPRKQNLRKPLDYTALYGGEDSV